jgi:hypothetical protein
MNVNEWGVFFRFSTGFDLTGFSALSLVFTKPDGTVVTKTNPDVTAPNVDVTTTEGLFPAGTYAQYTFQPGDVDQAGVWCVYATYDDGSQHLIADVQHFTISANSC